jgi:hypothetical protein
MTDFTSSQPVAPASDDISAYVPPAAAPTPVPVVAPAPMAAAVPVAAPVEAPVTPTPAPAAPAEVDAESLEAQNIFELLGVSDGTEVEKENFLDELQQVIWEDFVEHDLSLLLTREELGQVQAIKAKAGQVQQQQEEIVGYIEKLVPDLEEIMLEKALELKRQMVRERIKGLRQYLAGKPDQLPRIDAIEQLMKADKWASVAKELNSIV